MLESLAAELPHGRVLILAGDLTDAVFRERLWDRAEAMPGGIDLLVNNAGMGNYADFATQDPARHPQNHRAQPVGTHRLEPKGRCDT